MSGKHNTKHYRSQSNYPQRLVDRGLSRAPEMPSLETLRKRQRAEEPKFDYQKPIQSNGRGPRKPPTRAGHGTTDRRKNAR